MQKLKFQPEVWKGHSAGTAFDAPQSFHVKLAEPGTLYIRIGSKDHLVGYGSEFKVDGPEQAFKVKCSKDCTVYTPPTRVSENKGEVYTNIDKTTYSAAEELVMRSIREQALRAQEARRAERRASLEQQRLRVELGQQEELSESAQRAEESVAREAAEAAEEKRREDNRQGRNDESAAA